MLTVVLVVVAIVTGVLLLVRANRHATPQENRITIGLAIAFVILLVIDRLW